MTSGLWTPEQVPDYGRNAEAAGPPSLERSSTGLEPHVAAALAYLAWWLTGIVFWALERESRYVRFHAAQSVVALGGLSALGVFFAFVGVLTLLVSASAFRTFLLLAASTWFAGIVVSLVCLYKAYSGERWKLPLAGNLAERWTADTRSL